MRDFNPAVVLPVVCLLGALVCAMLANVTLAVFIWVCASTQRLVNRQWEQAFRR